jgi:hypothetical protein
MMGKTHKDQPVTRKETEDSLRKRRKIKDHKERRAAIKEKVNNSLNDEEWDDLDDLPTFEKI